MKKDRKKGIILVLLLLFPSLVYIIFTTGNHNFNHLEYYGPKEVMRGRAEGKEQADTLYYTVPRFSFFDPQAKVVNQHTVNDKIRIVSFFHTRCGDHCTLMLKQLSYVQEKLSKYDSVLILTHTVDPERDSLSLLAEFSKNIHADPERWLFLSGIKSDIYRMAAQGYLLDEMKDSGGLNHNARLVLVDKKGHIRGYYGNTTKEIHRLVDGVKVLLADDKLLLKKNKKNKK